MRMCIEGCIHGMESTQLYDGAREKVRAYLNATSLKEIIFTGGATESVNLVAQSYARSKLQAGDRFDHTYGASF